MKYFISADGERVVGVVSNELVEFVPLKGPLTTGVLTKVAAFNLLDQVNRMATPGGPAGVMVPAKLVGKMLGKRKYTKKVAAPKGEKRGRSVLSEEMKDDAVEWYEAGDGTDEIAEKLGVSRPTIVKALRERKVKMKRGKRTVAATDEDGVEVPEVSEAPEPPKPYVPKISPERLADCKRLIGKGETMADIATKTGLDESQVERIAVSMGL